MQARLLAFVIWAAVAASAVFWLLRLWSSSPTAPAHTVAVAPATPPRGDLTRVFGAPPPASTGPVAGPSEPALASRFKLLGVAAPRQGGGEIGLALIAVDGKPARGFKVGAAVDGNLVLQSVHARGAALGPSGASPAVALELPALPGAINSGARTSPIGDAAPMMMPPPGAGPTMWVPPPPVLPGPMPGLRPPEAGESTEPEPVAPGRPALTR